MLQESTLDPFFSNWPTYPVSRVGYIGVVVLLLAAGVLPAYPIVTITGGPDESGHHYSWTIEHDYDSRIVYVRFPHFLADLFTPPDGWKASITHPATEGPKNGQCTAVAVDASRGIARGSPATFRMRVGPYAGVLGARCGEGDVLIRFADGTEVVIRARVPVSETFLDRHVSLIGFAVIGSAVLLVRSARRRRARASAKAESAGA